MANGRDELPLVRFLVSRLRLMVSGRLSTSRIDRDDRLRPRFQFSLSPTTKGRITCELTKSFPFGLS